MTYQQLPNIFYTSTRPTPVRDAQIYLYNQALSDALDLDSGLWNDPNILSGNQLHAHFQPIAQAYFGHQFGYLTMLGDGRAILLDEILSPDGLRYDIQLKGSGPTLYSRRGDGRAALGPMLREYLISEAMHALGIPTSRSLAVVTTGEMIERERPLPGAILTRVAASHIRVGTFQYAANQGEGKALADYTIERHYPECLNSPEPYLCLLEQVIERQAKLIAQWQSVGFIHGVMNTDNMTLSGETIDYGPCAFMDSFKQDQVFSSIDRSGRYRYSQQPPIAQWNLARLAETLIELIDPDQERAVAKANTVLKTFESRYQAHWLGLFSQKLGLKTVNEDHRIMIGSFLNLLENQELDFTNSFIQLSDNPETPLFDTPAGQVWQEQWINRIKEQGSIAQAMDLMKQANPRVIPRNQHVDKALTAAESGDREPFDQLLAVIQQPFVDPQNPDYQQGSKPGDRFVTYCGT